MPAASASSRVVVPSKPFSAKTATAASKMRWYLSAPRLDGDGVSAPAAELGSGLTKIIVYLEGREGPDRMNPHSLYPRVPGSAIERRLMRSELEKPAVRIYGVALDELRVADTASGWDNAATRKILLQKT